MGTVGDLAAVGAVAVLGYVGIKWLSGQNFGSGQGGTITLGGSGTQPSAAANTIVDGFGAVQQDIADATAISKATSQTVIDAANLQGGLVSKLLDVPIVGGLLQDTIKGLSSKAATEYTKSTQYQNYKAARDAAETTTNLDDLRTSISGAEGLTASQKRDLERSLRNTVA